MSEFRKIKHLSTRPIKAAPSQSRNKLLRYRCAHNIIKKKRFQRRTCTANGYTSGNMSDANCRLNLVNILTSLSTCSCKADIQVFFGNFNICWVFRKKRHNFNASEACLHSGHFKNLCIVYVWKWQDSFAMKIEKQIYHTKMHGIRIKWLMKQWYIAHFSLVFLKARLKHA